MISFKNTPLGKLPEDWELMKVIDYCHTTDYVANGSFKSLADNVKYNSCEKYAVLIRLTDYHNDFNGDFVYIDENAYNFLNKSTVYGGEIIISNVGANTGTVFLAPHLNKKMSLGPNSIMVKTNGDDNFYYYWFKSYIGQATIQSIITGSAQPKFNKTNFRNLLIPVPKLEEQKNISEFLLSFDNKIETNNNIIRKLEEIIQNLYKYWFVDFNFPDEGDQPYKSNGGKMKDSELGLIPQGWEIKEISDLFNFVGGSQPPKKEHIYEQKEGYVRFIQNRDYGGDEKHLTYIKESPRNKLCTKIDILMDKYGEAGKVRFGIEGAYNVALAKIETNDVDREFVRRYFEQETIERYILNASQASTRPSVNQTVFTNLKIAYPNKDVLNKFNVVSLDIVNKILLLREENNKLIETQDSILPKIMSGEIRLPFKED